MRHLQLLHNAAYLPEKLRRVFSAQRGENEKLDPELAIYRGFANDADKRLFGEVRRTPPAELGKCKFGFRDPRYADLLFRYRARNFPQSLDADEHIRWETFQRERLTTSTPLTTLTLDEYFAAIATERAVVTTDGTRQTLLDQLELWGRDLAIDINNG
jgi:exodeoxyribonuclease-1